MGAEDYVHIGRDMLGINTPPAYLHRDAVLLCGGVEAVVFFAIYSGRENFNHLIPSRLVLREVAVRGGGTPLTVAPSLYLN